MSNIEKKQKLSEKIDVLLICNVIQVFNYIFSFLSVIFVTNELMKKLERYDQQTDVIMFHMYYLKNCFDWVESMGTIILGFGVVVFFDYIFLNCVRQKKKGIFAIVSGAIIIVGALIGNIYISRLGY